jgi:hemerythrin-like domain-containing protein
MKATDILMTEHRAIERGLTVLEHAAGRIREGENLRKDFLRDTIRFIRLFADRCHHGKEEGFLFPALERQGFPRQAGPLAVMQFEHDEGRKLVGAMTELLGDVESGKSGAAAAFAGHAGAFSSLLRDHIRKEDEVLFVMAAERIPPDEQESLARDFDNAEATGEACVLKSELLAMLGRLEEEVSGKTDNVQ